MDLAMDPHDLKIPRFTPCSDSEELREVRAVSVGLIKATPVDMRNNPG
jgi:hypothetical protein